MITLTIPEAASALDITEFLVSSLIRLGVIRAAGFRFGSDVETTILIPSHEVSRLLREGFRPFSPIASDPQTNNISHETALGHLIAAATQTQLATRRMKELRTATENGDLATIQRFRDEQAAHSAERVRQFKQQHGIT